MSVNIRDLRTDDWEHFRDLRLKALREHPKAYGIAEADEASRSEEEWKSFCQPGKYFMVAETENRKLIGMLGAIEVFGQHMRHQVEIVQGYVDPVFRRLKVMDRLFVALKERLKKIDYLEQMIAWVTLHEEQVSKRMAEQWGFKLAGTLSKTVKYEGKYYDCCWLEARL